MSGRRTQTSAGKKTQRRLTCAQAATAATVMELEPIPTIDTAAAPASNPGAHEETPELGNPPPRMAKVKALGNKVWKAVMPAPKRKCAPIEPDLSRVITTSQAEDDEAGPPKKPRTKVIQGGDPGLQRTSGQSAARITGHPRARTTTTRRTVVVDSPADEVSSGDEEPSDADKPLDDDDQSESGDDPILDDGGDDLDAYLAAEPIKFSWPDNFDNSSGSEFHPEDEDKEDELEEESADKVEVGRELATVHSTSSKAPRKVKALSKAQLAKQELERPTWKQGSPGTSRSSASTAHANVHAAASSQAAKPTSSPCPVYPIMPAPTPISVHSDTLLPPLPDDDRDVLHASETAAAADNNNNNDNDSDNDGNDDTDAIIDLVTNPPTQSFVLVFPPGGGPLNISPQQPPVQVTLHGANATVIKNVVFQNAFPDTFGRSKFVADALLDAATVHGYTGLVEHLKNDPPFLRAMSGVAKQCISNFQGTIKKAAEGFVLSFYGIGALPPAECADKISFMLENLTYIYPFIYEPGRRSVPWHKPYSHPCVLALLTASFFQEPKSIAAKYPDLFPSSCLERPQEHEIPPSMLALVGVAIHAALAEWKSGLHRAIPFAADSFIDVYNEHMMTIKGIKPKKIGAY